MMSRLFEQAICNNKSALNEWMDGKFDALVERITGKQDEEIAALKSRIDELNAELGRVREENLELVARVVGLQIAEEKFLSE